MSAEDNGSMVRARGEDGGTLVPENMQVPVTRDHRRMQGERRYMAQVAKSFDEADFSGLAQRILKDAFGDDADPKVVNAAREWLRKVALGDGRVSVEDLDCPPAVVRKR